jgi:hypothetical protein
MSEELHEGAAAVAKPAGLPVVHQPDQEILIAREGDRATGDSAMSGAVSAMWSVLDKLEQTLDYETSQLMAMRAADFTRLNETKSRLLLDTSRAARALRDEIGDVQLQARLQTLRLKLEQNRLAVGMHLEAVREVAAVMTSTLIDAESDGTYRAWPGQQMAVAAAGKARTA